MFYNNAAKIVIYSGGISVIIAVLGILVFIFNEAYPLFSSAKSESTKIIHNFKLESEKPIAIGVDEYEEVAFVLTDSSNIDFIDIKKSKIIFSHNIAEINNERITCVYKNFLNNYFACGTDEGRVAVLSVRFNSSFDSLGIRSIKPELESSKVFNVDSVKRDVKKIALAVNTNNEITIASLVSENEISLSSESISSSLLGEAEVSLLNSKIILHEEKISDIEIDANASKLAIGTSDGILYLYSLLDKSNPELLLKEKVNLENSTIAKLRFILGDQSLLVSDSKGNISSYVILQDSRTGNNFLVQPHFFSPMKSEVKLISPSQRDKSFIVVDEKNNVEIKHLTSNRTLTEIKISQKSGIRDIAYSPKSNGAVVLYDNGIIEHFTIAAAHSEVSPKILFGKVWYEGYAKPEYVWQSTSGTDDFEPKFSLIPLIFGTLKGTLYALFFAIPIALLGALYTALFVHPKIKNIIKTSVEIMAALPSVVIGMLAGLWLAPLLEKILPGVLLIFFTAPLMMFVGVYIWKNLIPRFGFKFKEGYEVVLLIPLLILGGQVALILGPTFENLVFGGDYRAWILNYLNESYDQRNSLVVGFAMGFAVIPIIFTICEDALSSVPKHLTSGALALGANRWQTAVRVVLPTASPGIFSAIMIGFGRAIGETMIVLMATGNTPILSLSPFNGFRTLSANIAVEIPEAPYLGTLYRVLFLSAVILFIMTFIVNTTAELVRQHLRKKYRDI